MATFTNLVPHYYTGVLSKYQNAIPGAAQWIIEFDSLIDIGNTIKKVIANFEPSGWNIDESIDNILLNSDALTTKGCLFAQAVEIPGENNTYVPVGLQQSGYLRTMAGGGRDPYQGIRVSFLDTTVSFTELFIKPWVITTSHVGLIDTPKYIYRTNMTVYKLGRRNVNDTEPVILRTYIFKGICPVGVSEEEYNYSPQTGPVTQQTTFVYNWYTIEGPNKSQVLDYSGDSVPLATPDAGNNITK